MKTLPAKLVGFRAATGASKTVAMACLSSACGDLDLAVEFWCRGDLPAYATALEKIDGHTTAHVALLDEPPVAGLLIRLFGDGFTISRDGDTLGGLRDYERHGAFLVAVRDGLLPHAVTVHDFAPCAYAHYLAERRTPQPKRRLADPPDCLDSQEEEEEEKLTPAKKRHRHFL
ncbi:hypothetical protein CTAYLR_001021 [Chrysophaeum taylorii]|uniref:Uncharacterized protein n=1 Tax=Chrysophaeum taylorii TaxID=2483200 RepID=A0AAD7UGZ9_9STRA|nr:hypothetical protein CTAYLR_001021 [Chrysophaeum taylorii]